MFMIKSIVFLLSVISIFHHVIFASFPGRTTLMFCNIQRRQRTPIQNIDQRSFSWQSFSWKSKVKAFEKWQKKIFGPYELPVIKEKGIDGYTEKEIADLLKDADRMYVPTLPHEDESPLTRLGKKAILESTKIVESNKKVVKRTINPVEKDE